MNLVYNNGKGNNLAVVYGGVSTDGYSHIIRLKKWIKTIGSRFKPCFPESNGHGKHTINSSCLLQGSWTRPVKRKSSAVGKTKSTVCTAEGTNELASPTLSSSLSIFIYVGQKEHRQENQQRPNWKGNVYVFAFNKRDHPQNCDTRLLQKTGHAGPKVIVGNWC